MMGLWLASAGRRIIEPSKEGQRMLMQEGMWQQLWVQEERF